MLINRTGINLEPINGYLLSAYVQTQDVIDPTPAVIKNSVPVTFVGVKQTYDTIDANPAVASNPEPVTDGYYLETAVLNDSVVTASYLLEYETAVVISNYTDYFVKMAQDVLETAAFSDSLDNIRQSIFDSTEVAVILSDYYEAQRIVTADLLDLTPALALSYAWPDDNFADALDDPAVIISTVTPWTIAVLEVTEGLVGSDAAYPNAYADLLDPTKPVVVSYIGPVVVSAVLADPVPAAATSDVSLGEDTRYVDVQDTAVLKSTADYITTLREAVFEVAYLESWISSPSGTDAESGWSSEDTWTCETSGWAMSRHTNTTITNRGKRFAVSDNGLFEESAAFVGARVETGYMDFGVSNKKRIPHVYISGSYDAPITVDVTAEVDGVRGTYTYVPLVDITNVPTVVRVDIGKKICSSYYKFGLTSTGKADFFGCEARATAVQRRV